MQFENQCHRRVAQIGYVQQGVGNAAPHDGESQGDSGKNSCLNSKSLTALSDFHTYYRAAGCGVRDSLRRTAGPKLNPLGTFRVCYL